MLIVDAHRDIAYDFLEMGRDYRLSVAETRAREAEESMPGREGPALTGLRDAIEAGVALVGATIYAEPAVYEHWGAQTQPQSLSKTRYATPEEAAEIAMRQVEWYMQATAEHPQLRLIRTRRDLDALLAGWADNGDPAGRAQGFLLLMEGADPIVQPEDFGQWHALGVRVVGTSWSRTRYAGGTRAPGPLTELGHRLLREMARYNAVLDLAHMSEESCLESLRTYPGPIVASHSNPRRFCNTDRHLTDEAIRLLAQRSGVMGLVLLNLFWMDDYRRDSTVPLARALDAVDYVCQLTGSAAHVGIGTDWFAGVGADETPEGIDSVSDLPRIATGLRARGYAEADVAAIMGGNFLRQYGQSLPE